MTTQKIQPKYYYTTHHEWENYRAFLSKSVENVEAVVGNYPSSMVHQKLFGALKNSIFVAGKIYPLAYVQNPYFPTEMSCTLFPSIDETQTHNICVTEFGKFNSYAKEILDLKGIKILKTLIRKWQAIEDPTWTQCILEMTLDVNSKSALSVWDELSDELEKFIDLEPEDVRSVLKDKLGLDIKWC